jgi:hypothetical protein
MSSKHSAIGKRPAGSSELAEGKSEGGAMTLLKVAGAIVAIVSGIIGLLFLILPDLKPEGSPSNQQANLSDLILYPNTSFAQYLERTGQTSEGFSKKELAVRGAFVEVRITIIGYEDVTFVLEWELIEESSGEIVSRDDSDRFTPHTNEQSDTPSFFADLPQKEAMFFIRLQLLRPGEYGLVPAATEKTESFHGLAPTQ